MKILFAHVSWMPEYSGDPDERISSTHGWVVKNNVAHERSNFRAINGNVYGYVPVREKRSTKAPGHIKIEKIGATKNENHVDGVAVVWFANQPDDLRSAYIVGWYRDARVFRDLQIKDDQEYRFTCRSKNATLISESLRKFPVPHARSLTGQSLGFGFGQSSIWYAEGAETFVSDVMTYVSHQDGAAIKKLGESANWLGDAIDDLDGFSIGNEKPDRKKFSGLFIVRDVRVRNAVIIRSRGKCEYCGARGFEKLDGTRFVEAHHIINLAEQGPDTLANVIALCPNHHREAHFGAERDQLEAAFLTKLSEIRGA